MTTAFSQNIETKDPDLSKILRSELIRQRNSIELIASENFTSLEVMSIQGSTLTNKYAEGYPGRRYYGGCDEVDKVEDLARDRLKQLYGCKYANVQPHSGSQTNQAVFLSLLQPGDTIMGMSMDAGGHLTHGASVNMSGKWFNPVFYGVSKESELINMDEVRALAHESKPKLIIAGASAYSRVIDFKQFREIADEVGAYFLVDMAHYSGLIAGKQYPNPFPHAHIVTSTTHKTLRGPRSGLILCDDLELHKKLNSAIFPGIQGGPLMHVIAAKAYAFGEALKPEFSEYCKIVISNCRAMADSLQSEGLRIVSGGTDSHQCSVDLSGFDVTGHDIEKALETAGITCNKNGIPFDPLPPMKTSGIRIGSAACTSRGFKEDDFKQIGIWISDIVKSYNSEQSEGTIDRVAHAVQEMCGKYPLYPELG